MLCWVITVFPCCGFVYLSKQIKAEFRTDNGLGFLVNNIIGTYILCTISKKPHEVWILGFAAVYVQSAVPPFLKVVKAN